MNSGRLSVVSARHDSGDGGPDVYFWHVILALGTFVAVVGFGFLSGAGAATVVDGYYEHGNESDGTAPTLTGGAPVNDTTFTVTIEDNHDVDEGTIGADDFILEEGSLENVSVSENGSDAVVTMILDRPVDEENLTVVVADGAVVEDTNGNRLDTSNAFTIVPGMDGVAPAVKEFTVTNATGGPATIRVRATEELRDFTVTVGGPGEDTLDASSFEPSDSGYAYERTYAPPGDGTVYLTLENVTDYAGNTRNVRFQQTILADLTPPTAVAALDLAASANLSITFDATQSADANGIASYTWQFGDGDTASGSRVTHDYLPGNYTVTLEVADPYGNNATDSLTLNLTRGSGDVSDVNESILRQRVDLNVTVDRKGDGVTSDALVTVDNAQANETVVAGSLDGTGTPLASHDAVTLDGVAVTLSTNRSFDLGVSLTGNGSIADAARATRTHPIGGITLVNAVPDDEIANATIQFSVDRSRLEALEATPANVSLYRYHGGAWNRLNTTALNASNTTQSFHAETPGFSRFAVLADTGARLTLTDATLETPRVAPGEQFSVTATVENSGSADGSFTAGLEANGTVVATESVSVPAGETGTVTLRTQSPDTGRFALSVNGTDAGTITVTADETGTNESTDDESTDSETTDGRVVVTNATLGSEQVRVGEPFTVNATVENHGEQGVPFTAAVDVDGSVVTTKRSLIPGGESRTIQLRGSVNESGEYTVAVNGTEAGTLTVGDPGGDSGDGGGGLLASVFGLVGLLPMGLLKPLFTFVVLPIAVIYGILKALAIYLGY